MSKERTNIFKAAILGACAGGPAPFDKIQCAVNLVAESFWQDISTVGTTVPAMELAMMLFAEGKLRVIPQDDNSVLYEAINPLPLNSAMRGWIRCGAAHHGESPKIAFLFRSGTKFQWVTENNDEVSPVVTSKKAANEWADDNGFNAIRNIS